MRLCIFSWCNPNEIRNEIGRTILKTAHLTLNDTAVTALRFIHQYRYLTVKQVATVVGLKEKSVSELLLRLARHKLLAWFGNTGTYGYGKTPKVYYLTKTGHRVLSVELEATGEALRAYRAINMNSRWSPKMKHRVATLDVMMALERGVQDRSGEYALAATLLEYRRQKVGGKWGGETVDYVAAPETAATRIVPDAGFVLENVGSGRRKLFLLEVDLGTETIVPGGTRVVGQSFREKIEKYDTYLTGGRFRERYAMLGEFQHFVLLTVTSSENRMANMRRALSDMPASLHQFYRFSKLDVVCTSFFHSSWRGRSSADQAAYSLIKEAQA